MKPATKTALVRGFAYFTIGYHVVELVRGVRSVFELDHELVFTTSPAPPAHDCAAARADLLLHMRFHPFEAQPSGDTWNRPECGLCGLSKDNAIHLGTPALPEDDPRHPKNA